LLDNFHAQSLQCGSYSGCGDWDKNYPNLNASAFSNRGQAVGQGIVWAPGVRRVLEDNRYILLISKKKIYV
jgi:hypothetical protein